MPLSLRAQHLQGSAIRQFMPAAAELKRRGVKVYHLNIGQPDVPAPPLFLEAVRRFDRRIIAYEPSQGSESLRVALVDYYARLGIIVQTEQIVVTAGGSEALIIAMGMICNPGDEIIIPEPYYTNYNTFAIQNEVTIVPFPTHLEDNFALHDPAALEALITSRTKAIVCCSPNNPTGAVLSRQEIEAVARIARRHDLFIIADEVYREFAYGMERAFSWLELPDLEDRLIVIDSVSKRYSLCGARIGWLVSRSAEIMTAALKYAQARLSVSTLEQAAVAEVIAQGDQEIQRAKQEYNVRRQGAYDFLRQAGIRCGYPAGALYLVADLGIDAQDFTRFMLTRYSRIEHERETVLITPAETFYKTPGQGKTQVRIAFVLGVEELEKALAHLLKGLEELRAA